jgi:hypothetical protein
MVWAERERKGERVWTRRKSKRVKMLCGWMWAERKEK